MKILQINVTYNNGSTGKIVYDLNSELKKRNNPSYAAYGFYSTTEPNTYKIIKGNSVNNVRFNLGLTMLTGYHGIFHKRETQKLIQWIDTIKPDVIHLHNIHGNFVNIEILFNYLKERNYPIIWTLHDCWSFTGHCAYFEQIHCSKWKKGCNHCKNISTYPKSMIFDHSESQWKVKKDLFSGIENMFIITPSKWLANYVKESFLNTYSIKTIHNGIDLEKFKPVYSDFKKNRSIENKIMILGIANSWDTRKGLDTFINLARLLPSKFIIVLVGLNSRQLKEVPNNIIKIGRTNNIQELVEIYTAADVFINPTLEDNYPTVNLEAQACGTPVITYDTGGCKETLIQNKNNNLIEKGNEKQLFENIIKRKDFPKLELKNQDLYHLDKKTFVNAYIDIYQKIITGNN